MPRKRIDKDSQNHFREWAGVLCAFIVVMSYVAIGFVQVFVQITTGTPATIPGDWGAAMLSLASAALGYLIGKQTTVPPGFPDGDTTVVIPTSPDDPCADCKKRYGDKGGEVESPG